MAIRYATQTRRQIKNGQQWTQEASDEEIDC